MIKKIKLVYIISNLSLGGAQILLLDILKNLKEKSDFDIYLITIDSGDYMKKFENSGINLIDLKEKGLINLKILIKLRKILKKINPDIVHTHLHTADFYGRIAAKQTGVPVIYSTCHNYSSHHKGADINKKSIFDIIDNLVISYSKSNLIAISEIVGKYLSKRKKEFEKVTEIIYNGVDIRKEKYVLNENEIIEFRKKYNLQKNDFVILISGRLEIQKGHKFFLESIKYYLKEKKNIKILILGDGSLRNEIENLIQKNDLSEYAKILGFQTETEKFIEISDLICVPSLWEGFGLVIVESMIKNKIVLAADVGGIPEIIDDGETGFLFVANNKESFLGKLNFIYNNIKKLESVKQNALCRVKEKFDIKKNTELYFQSYKKNQPV